MTFNFQAAAVFGFLVLYLVLLAVKIFCGEGSRYPGAFIAGKFLIILAIHGLLGCVVLRLVTWADMAESGALIDPIGRVRMVWNSAVGGFFLEITISSWMAMLCGILLYVTSRPRPKRKLVVDPFTPLSQQDIK